MKKFISVTLVALVLLVVSLITISMNTVQCTPWSEGYFQESGIKTSKLGIDMTRPITGVEAIKLLRSFGYPAKNDLEHATNQLTRAELAHVLVNNGMIKTSVRDVWLMDIEGEKYKQDIQTVANSGILCIHDNCYRPEDPVTREEFFVLLVEVTGQHLSIKEIRTIF